MAGKHISLRDKEGVLKAKFTLEHGLSIVKKLPCRTTTNKANKPMFVCDQDYVFGNSSTTLYIWAGDALIIEEGSMA